uniref:Insulin like growth factor binding protein 4 n=1 Tax=Chelydra serpentina TaxID=8475 RepID=A0A8C3T5Y2_CHESE
MPSGGLSAVLLLATVGLCASDEAIHCPPCSEEKLTRCKAPVGCEELVREPGCGCCATCALSKGTPCGVYTARCGSGLRCYPPRGVEKPLHTLMHGQGVCTELSEIESLQESLQPADKEEIDHPNNSFSPCSIQDRKCLLKQQAKTRDRVNSGVKMRSNGNAHHREETRQIVRHPFPSPGSPLPSAAPACEPGPSPQHPGAAQCPASAWCLGPQSLSCKRPAWDSLAFPGVRHPVHQRTNSSPLTAPQKRKFPTGGGLGTVPQHQPRPRGNRSSVPLAPQALQGLKQGVGLSKHPGGILPSCQGGGFAAIPCPGNPWEEAQGARYY